MSSSTSASSPNCIRLINGVYSNTSFHDGRYHLCNWTIGGKEAWKNSCKIAARHQTLRVIQSIGGALGGSLLGDWRNWDDLKLPNLESKGSRPYSNHTCYQPVRFIPTKTSTLDSNNPIKTKSNEGIPFCHDSHVIHLQLYRTELLHR